MDDDYRKAYGGLPPDDPHSSSATRGFLDRIEEGRPSPHTPPLISSFAWTPTPPAPSSNNYSLWGPGKADPAMDKAVAEAFGTKPKPESGLFEVAFGGFVLFCILALVWVFGNELFKAASPYINLLSSSSLPSAEQTATRERKANLRALGQQFIPYLNERFRDVVGEVVDAQLDKRGLCEKQCVPSDPESKALVYVDEKNADRLSSQQPDSFPLIVHRHANYVIQPAAGFKFDIVLSLEWEISGDSVMQEKLTIIMDSSKVDDVHHWAATSIFRERGFKDGAIQACRARDMTSAQEFEAQSCTNKGAQIKLVQRWADQRMPILVAPGTVAPAVP